jgi:hypothetical protein
MRTRKKTAIVTCRITEEQAHDFKVKCAVEETTMQEVLEQAIVT